jgi:muramoyltetrapeptide carboxypeptidase
VSRRRPPALRPGDRIGVCAPAGAVDGEALDRGLAALRALGFDVVEGESVRARSLFAAGTAAARVRDLQALWDDDSVAGIVCARGGAGAGAVAGAIDGGALAARPKVFMGYSDVTQLHTLLNAEGLVTFHGPMVAKDFAEGLHDEASLRAALGATGGWTAGAARTLRAGEAWGTLLGGCLSVLGASAGTPWALQPDTKGTILFLEDLNEPPYRLHRTLTQLRASGAFAGVRGVLFGEMKDCGARDVPYTLEDVLLDALSAGLDVPVAIGLPSGHTTGSNVTLPLGVRAHLSCPSAAPARLDILEAAVS